MKPTIQIGFDLLHVVQPIFNQASWRIEFQIGKNHFTNREFENCIKVFKSLLDTAKFNTSECGAISIHRRLSDAYLSLGQLDEALSHSIIAIGLSKVPSERDYIRKSRIYEFLSEHKKSRKTLIEYGHQFQKTRVKPQVTDNIIVVALPKSGSTSITNAMAAQSKKDYIEFPNRQGKGLFSNSIPVYSCYRQIQDCGIIMHSHLSPKQKYIDFLATVPNLHIVLHLRDPREALISILDMVHRQNTYQIISRNRNLLNLSIVAQLDWMIEQYLPFQVRWISSWLKIVNERPALNIAVSSFNDLKKKGQNAAAFEQLEKLSIYADPISQESTKRWRYNQRLLKGTWADLTNNRQKDKAMQIMEGNFADPGH
jgi:hypothetical protein